jgi:uncharacterized glyoxalase superfamily protein PhnB
MMATPDLVGFVVRNMAESLRFYRLLGLALPTEVDNEPHVEITLPGGFRIAWDTLDLMKSIHPDWIEPTGQRMALAFKCESPAEVDALYARIIQSGYHGYRVPWDAFWGQRYATLIDPDGCLVDLFAAL